MFNPWLTLTLRTFELGIEAQNVVALRLLRIASGGASGQAEVNRMVTEKIEAVAEAQAVAAAAVMNGQDHHVVVAPDPLIVGSSSLVIGGRSEILESVVHPGKRRKA